MGFDVKAALVRALEAENQEFDGGATAKPAKAAKQPVAERASLASLARLAADHPSISENHTRTGAQLPEGLHPDAVTYLDFLHRVGPMTYGAAATTLGWGGTRAWQAEARLRAAGLVRHDGLGKAHPVADLANGIVYHGGRVVK